MIPDYVGLLADLVHYLFYVPLIPIAVYGLRLMQPRLPRLVVLAMPYVLAQAAVFLEGLATGHGYNAVAAAAVGGMAHILREWISTANEHGLS